MSSAAWLGSIFRYAADIEVADNVMDWMGRHAVAVTDGGRNIRILRNTIDHCAWYCVDVEPNGLTINGQAIGADHITIEDNAFGAVGLREPACSTRWSASYAAKPARRPPMSDFAIRNNGRRAPRSACIRRAVRAISG